MVSLSSKITFLAAHNELDYPVMRSSDDAFLTARDVINNNIDFHVSSTPDWELLRQRVNMRYADNKLITVGCMSYGEITPERRLREVNKIPLTELGMLLLRVENSSLKYLAGVI